jgi:hypothetical protein
MKFVFGVMALIFLSFPAKAQQVNDVCSVRLKASVAISQSTSALVLAGTAGKKTYVCSMVIVSSDAENVSLVEGTGSVCATGIAALIGSTTAANGPNLAANGGFSLGNSQGTVAAGAGSGYDICLLQSGSGRVAGVMTYVQQ